jgi:hypothetical protein
MALKPSLLVQEDVDVLVKIDGNRVNVATVTHDGGAWEWASSNKRDFVDMFKVMLDNEQFEVHQTAKGDQLAKVRLAKIGYEVVLENAQKVAKGARPRAFRNIKEIVVAPNFNEAC